MQFDGFVEFFVDVFIVFVFVQGRAVVVNFRGSVGAVFAGAGATPVAAALCRGVVALEAVGASPGFVSLVVLVEVVGAVVDWRAPVVQGLVVLVLVPSHLRAASVRVRLFLAHDVMRACALA